LSAEDFTEGECLLGSVPAEVSCALTRLSYGPMVGEKPEALLKVVVLAPVPEQRTTRTTAMTRMPRGGRRRGIEEPLQLMTKVLTRSRRTGKTILPGSTASRSGDIHGGVFHVLAEAGKRVLKVLDRAFLVEDGLLKAELVVKA